MSFKDFFYATVAFRAAFILLIIGYMVSTVADSDFRSWIFYAFLLLIVFNLVALPILTGRIGLRCPHCGQSRPVKISKKEGLWMECDPCGISRGRGLKITREPLPLKMADDESDDE